MPAQLLPDFYLSQVHQNIERVSFWLEHLKTEGQITAFTPLPAANAIQVHGSNESKGDMFNLEDLPEVVRMTSADTAQVAAARQALTGIWEGTVAAQGEAPLQGTNPSIFVNETYDYVYGYTDAYASVTVVLKDSGGSTKETGYDTADSGGYYYVEFYASVDPGDVVEVTADGNFASLTVDALTGQVDHVNDQVTGAAPAGRTMYASILQSRASCTSESDGDRFSSGAGSFSVTFPVVPDIIRGASVSIWCYDANGNATGITRRAPVLWVDGWMNRAEGYVESYAALTAVLKNAGGGVRETVSGTASESGYCQARFAPRFAAGDRVELTSGGDTMVMPLNLTGDINTAADTVSGTAHGQGVPLVVYAYHYDTGYWYCVETTASSASPYAYTADFGIAVDLVEGDHAHIRAYSADYNYYEVRTYAYICEETPIPNFTTHDNENNTHTGTCDGDMDVYLYNVNPPAPIEFNILVTEPAIESAWLLINAWDIDEEAGELDAVYFNGYFLGYLTGANATWSTSAFNVNPAWVHTGNNLVGIDIDVLHPNEQWWATRVDWGQLLLNQEKHDAYFRQVQLDQTGYEPESSISVEAELDTDLISQTLDLEFNLIGPDGFTIDGQVYSGWTIYGAGDEPYFTSFDLSHDAEPGIYQIQALAFDSDTGFLQDTERREFVVDRLGVVQTNRAPTRRYHRNAEQPARGLRPDNFRRPRSRH
jgi:hypothetical protein